MALNWQKIKKPLLISAIVFGVPFGYLLGHLGYNYFSGNVHTVIPNRVYRTGQLNIRGLTKYSKKYHWKSLINLRGVWKTNPWYQVESRFVKTHGLHYFPLQLSAYLLPTKKQLGELVHILQTAPQPYAFHCEGGADRTGLAAGISVILFQKNPTKLAIEKQDSWHYNAISRETVGYQVFSNFFVWLKQHHYQLSKKRFLQWVASPVKMKAYHGRFWV